MTQSIKLLFLGSILLNILLLGFVIGNEADLFGNKKFSRRAPVDLSALPPDVRNRLDGVMKDAFERNRPLHEEIRETRREAITILETEPFDEKAFEEKIDTLFVYMEQMGKSMTNVIKDFAQDVEPEHRAVIARMIMRGPPPRDEPPAASKAP